MSKSMDTICVHGKEHAVKDQNYAISYPIYQTASFSHLTPGHNPNGFDYTRESNPTRSLLEETVSALEAAVAAVFEYFKPRDHVICSEDLYGGVVRLAAVISAKNNIEVEYVDTSDLQALKAAVRENTKAIYFETPTNPMMHVTDIRAAAEIAKEAGALLIVDNTFMTPYFQNPLSLGADVVIHSGTKYLSGHNDTICGFLCSKDQKLAQHFRLISKTTGGTLAPFESWLCLRGLKTLALRMERHQSNALAAAEWLKKQDCVENVEIALIFSNYFKNIVDIPEKMCYKI